MITESSQPIFFVYLLATGRNVKRKNEGRLNFLKLSIDTNSRTNYVIFNRINNLPNLQCLSNVYVLIYSNSLKFLYQFFLVIKNANNRRAQGHHQFDFQQYLFIYLQKSE